MVAGLALAQGRRVDVEADLAQGGRHGVIEAGCPERLGHLIDLQGAHRANLGDLPARDMVARPDLGEVRLLRALRRGERAAVREPAARGRVRQSGRPSGNAGELLFVVPDSRLDRTGLDRTGPASSAAPRAGADAARVTLDAFGTAVLAMDGTDTGRRPSRASGRVCTRYWTVKRAATATRPACGQALPGSARIAAAGWATPRAHHRTRPGETAERELCEPDATMSRAFMASRHH